MRVNIFILNGNTSAVVKKNELLTKYEVLKARYVDNFWKIKEGYENGIISESAFHEAKTVYYNLVKLVNHVINDIK